MPHLHGRAPLAERRLGRDRPAVADGLRRRVTLEPLGRGQLDGPPRRLAESRPNASSTASSRAQCAALPAMPRGSASVSGRRSTSSRRTTSPKSPGWPSWAAQSCDDSTSNAVSTVSPVTYGPRHALPVADRAIAQLDADHEVLAHRPFERGVLDHLLQGDRNPVELRPTILIYGSRPEQPWLSRPR